MNNDTGNLAVRRVKEGSPSTHPIVGDELRALRRLAREQDPKSPFVFTSERGSPLTTAYNNYAAVSVSSRSSRTGAFFT